MRRTTTLTALTALVLPLGLGLPAAPAQAAETCDGKVATIVVAPKPGSFMTDPVLRTPGDDVIVGRDRCLRGERLESCERRR